jgi:hypothetical protein
MLIWHQQSVTTDHARKDVLLAIPPVQVTLSFVVLDVFSRQIVDWHRRIRPCLPLIVVTNMLASQLADETFINLPIFVW